jgi:ATP-dependent RNA helicase DDX55/SPB4
LVLLANYLTTHKDHKTIVFFNTRDSVDFYFKVFKSYIADRHQLFGDYFADKIHGDMKQAKRLAVLQAFDSKEQGLLFATDVIARGIDIEKIDSIIQVDIPQDPNFYIHRIGRTARQGKQGKALVLVEEGEKPYIEYLLEKLVSFINRSQQSRSSRTLSAPTWLQA